MPAAASPWFLQTPCQNKNPSAPRCSGKRWPFLNDDGEKKKPLGQYRRGGNPRGWRLRGCSTEPTPLKTATFGAFNSITGPNCIFLRKSISPLLYKHEWGEQDGKYCPIHFYTPFSDPSFDLVVDLTRNIKDPHVNNAPFLEVKSTKLTVYSLL